MRKTESAPMDPTEYEPKIIVELIAPDGLGYGEGDISVEKQLREGILTEESLKRVNEVLTEDPETFKQVEVDDDGCGDGRPWGQIVQWVKGQTQFFKKSRLRAKVFGGGLVTASSMWRTIKGEPMDDDTVGQDRAFMAHQLAELNFKHGAHSSDHAPDGDCGCGAIDRYPLITKNVTKYRTAIGSTLEKIYGDDYDDNRQAIEEAFGVYESIAEENGYYADAGGEQSMDQILKTEAVIKELQGGHVEETIVLNYVSGTTLDQQHFTERVKAACSEGQKPTTIQAFSVDVWRGQDIANVVAEIAKSQDPGCDVEHIRKLAMADFLIRTLAVSATLTAGDLPVYRRHHA